MVGFNILLQKVSVEFGKLVLFTPAREKILIDIFIDHSLFCIGADRALM